jgi:hypothetical protein
MTGCAGPVCWPVPATFGSPSRPTSFGATVYSQDDVDRAVSLIMGSGGTVARIGLGDTFAFPDAFFAAAAPLGIRVILISPYATQPVDVNAYAMNCAAIQQRYARYNPIWEIWNEPNLEFYWGANPDVTAYTQLAIATAQALRTAGATDIWSGGTSGIDLSWTRQMIASGAFDVMNGCAVHTYELPCTQYGQYQLLLPLMPAGVQIHTTETCIPSTQDQDSFLQQMWYIHRGLGLPTIVWCELRDGTAGHFGAYTLPYGLVYSDYTPKPVYYVAQALTATGHK